MKLHRAFDIMRGDVVSFIGAGGKTSTLINLGHELKEMGWRVLATTTTRIHADQLDVMPYAVTPREGPGLLSMALSEFGFVFVYERISGGYVYGPKPEYIAQLLDAVDSDVLLVEADSAGGLPLKAPFPDEPIIPPGTSLVVPVASVSALGQELDEDHIYNAQAIIERYGFIEGQRVKSPWLAQVVRDETLGLARIPEKARVIALLNQVMACGFERGRARLIARLILRSPRLAGVAIGSVRGANPIFEVQRPVAAVVLAAGLSRRMGQSKVLLPWTGRVTILEQIIRQLVLSRIDYITVVTGYEAAAVRDIAVRRGVESVHNPHYATGEMLSSLKAGLASLPGHVQAVLVVLGDQPRIHPRTIAQVLNAYAEGKGYIVAPSYQQQRGHPVLIDRRYWPEIMDLAEGSAPREVLQRHQADTALIDVDTDSILGDVDTPEDYQRERWRAGLRD